LLVVVFTMQAAIIVLRMLNLLSTAFMTSDEANYVIRSFYGAPYGFRYFFDYQLIALFRLFSIESYPQFFVFLPFYLAFWSFLFIFFAYKTVGLLTANRQARNLVVLSLPFMVSYSLLSVGVLSEPPALATCMIGIYFWVRYLKTGRKWQFVALSSLAFVAAAYSREPYLIFPVAVSFFWLLWGFLRRVNPKHPIIFVGFALLMALPGSPLFGSAGTVSAPPSLNQPIATITTTSAVTSMITHTYTYTVTVSGTVQVRTNTTTITAVTNMTVTSSSGQAPNRFYTLASLLANSIQLFLLGMLLGWGPIPFAIGFAALLFTIRQLFKDRSSFPFFFLALLSLGTFYFIVLLVYNTSEFLTGQGISYLIRLTNPTIPAFVLLAPFVVEKLSERRLKILAILLVVVTAGTAGFYITSVQSNFALPYNVLDFSHPSAQLVARNYLVQNTGNTSSTVVVLSWDWPAAQLYLKGISNLVLFPTFRDSDFSENRFEALRPDVFYILSEAPLHWDNTSSITSNVHALTAYDPPVYMSVAYATVFKIGYVNPATTPFIIDSAYVVFSSPTGHMLKVHVSWNNG
jgi:hypothetical protein